LDWLRSPATDTPKDGIQNRVVASDQTLKNDLDDSR